MPSTIQCGCGENLTEVSPPCFMYNSLGRITNGLYPYHIQGIQYLEPRNMGDWNSAAGLMHTSACITIFCSPARYSLLAIELTIPGTPVYGVTTIHREQYKVISDTVSL